MFEEGPSLKSQSDVITEQFYNWEKKGRGWSVYPYPVDLEPPFQPFLFHFIQRGPINDDGRKPTFFSTLADRLLRRPVSSAKTDTAFVPPDEMEPEPEPSVFYEDTELIEIQIS